MIKVSVVKKTRRKGKQTAAWYLRWTCPISGKRKWEATGCTRKKNAEDLAKEKQDKLEQIAAGTYDETEELRHAAWGEAKEAFLKYIMTGKRPATHENYERSLRHFERIVKPKSARAINVIQIDAFKAGCQKTMKAVSINKHLRQIGRFLRWGKDRGYVEKIPKMERLREVKKKKVCIHGDDQKKLIAAIDDPECDIRFCSPDWWKVWTMLLFYSRMRRGEMYDLLWSDIDFRSKFLLVRGEHEKTHRDRMIPLSNNVRALLKWWWLVSEKPKKDRSVFPLRCGTRQAYDDWMRIRKHAGVGAVSFKNARSTAGTEVYAKHDLGAAQNWLGHSTPAITAEHYADSAETLRQVAAGRKVIR